MSHVESVLAYREAEGRSKLTTLYNHPDVPIAVDTETTGLTVAGGDDTVIGVSIATVVDGVPISHYFPTAHETGQNIDAETFAMLQFVLEQEGRPLIWCNVQFDAIGLYHQGIDVREQEFYDIPTMANLINENTPQTKSLEMLGRHYLGDMEGKVKDKFVDAEKKSGNHNITPEQIYEYAVVDAELTWRIWAEMITHKNWIDISESTDVWEEKQKLIRVLMVMRMRGVLVDLEVATDMEALGSLRMAELIEELGFDPAKRLQLAKVLLEDLGLPVLARSKKTKAPSFTRDVMEQYDELLGELDNPVAKLINEFRGWQKAVTASYRPYIKLVESDGRIRCSFNTHRTTTGRLSSSEPNLQQVPKVSDKPWNGKMKDCFIARPGYVLRSYDYSQLELRLATAYSGEESLKEIFAEGRDLFTEMSIQLGMTRGNTKTFVYSMQYGAGEANTMRVFKVNKVQAQQMRSNYQRTYPRLRALNDDCTMRAETALKVRIWSGRYRHFLYKNEGYKAMNSVIQGGAADIVERVMVRVFDEIDDEENCRMLLQVHDALVFEIKEEYVDYYDQEIVRIMEDVNGALPEPLFDVVFNVEASDWAE